MEQSDLVEHFRGTDFVVYDLAAQIRRILECKSANFISKILNSFPIISTMEFIDKMEAKIA